MDIVIISIIASVGVILWFVFFAKHLMNWMFSIKKRTDLMEQQNDILRQIRDELKKHQLK